MCLETKETTMEMLEAYAKSTQKRIKKCLKWSRRGATAAGHPADPRTSGAPDIRALAGNPAPLSRRHPWLNPSSPDIRPLGPDIRRLGKARTSGPRPDIRPLSAHSVSGLRPMYPSPTYPFVDLDYIYPSTSS